MTFLVVQQALRDIIRAAGATAIQDNNIIEPIHIRKVIGQRKQYSQIFSSCLFPIKEPQICSDNLWGFCFPNVEMLEKEVKERMDTLSASFAAEIVKNSIPFLIAHKVNVELEIT